MSDQTVTDILKSAVQEFEALFEDIDDSHMHSGEARTAQGSHFIKVVPGTAKVTEFIPYEDRLACVTDWAAAARAVINDGAKVLVWRVQPHFVDVPGTGGFTLESMFATEVKLDPNAGEAKRRLFRKPVMLPRPEEAPVHRGFDFGFTPAESLALDLPVAAEGDSAESEET